LIVLSFLSHPLVLKRIFDELMQTKAKTQEHPYALLMATYAQGNRVDFKLAKENLEKGEKIFELMQERGVKPTNHSLEARLLLYTRALRFVNVGDWIARRTDFGLDFRLNRAIEIKDSWTNFGYQPNTKAYNSLIDVRSLLKLCDTSRQTEHSLHADVWPRTPS